MKAHTDWGKAGKPAKTTHWLYPGWFRRTFHMTAAHMASYGTAAALNAGSCVAYACIGSMAGTAFSLYSLLFTGCVCLLHARIERLRRERRILTHLLEHHADSVAFQVLQHTVRREHYLNQN